MPFVLTWILLSWGCRCSATMWWWWWWWCNPPTMVKILIDHLLAMFASILTHYVWIRICSNFTYACNISLFSSSCHIHIVCSVFWKKKKERKNNFLWSTSSYSSALPQGISTGMQGFPFVLSCTSHKTGVGFSEIKHCNKSPRLNFK